MNNPPTESTPKTADRDDLEALVKRLREKTSQFVLTPTLPNGAEGPPCIWCNAPTRRTGACYTCIACGATTSC